LELLNLGHIGAFARALIIGGRYVASLHAIYLYNGSYKIGCCRTFGVEQSVVRQTKSRETLNRGLAKSVKSIVSQFITFRELSLFSDRLFIILVYFITLRT
jgi:hypothetical protein